MLSRFFFRIFILLSFCLPKTLHAQTPEVITLCSGGGLMTSNALSGVVYDPGGPSGNYYDYQNCQLLLDPGCAAGFNFHLLNLETESCCDFLAFYDADNPGSPALYVWRGYANDAFFQMNYNRVLVYWYTDGSVIAPGFELEWEVIQSPSSAPDLYLTVSDTTPALLQTITFEAHNNGGGAYYTWDFGDGTTATGSAPEHQYTQPGAYTAQCIATNCEMVSDTATIQVTMQPPSMVHISTDTIIAAGDCSGSIFGSFSIRNDGDGEMTYYAYLNNLPFNYALNPNQGIIAPDSSITVTVEFFAGGAFPTIYFGELIVLANDSAMSPVITPVQLSVSAVPAAVLNTTGMEFGGVAQFTTANQYLIIYSIGCDKLIINNASVDNPSFGVDSVSGVEIDPGNAYYLLVNCVPQDTGLITGNLFLETNGGNFTLPITVYSIASPFAVITPDTLDADISCGDSATVVFYLKNEGTAELTINPVPSGFPAKVLFLSSLSYYPYPEWNMAGAMSSVNPSTQFISLPDGLQPDELSAYFSQADMVVAPIISGFGSYTPEQIKAEIENYADNGGTVLITGTPFIGVLQTLDIFNSNSDYYNMSSQVFDPVDPQHEFLQNIDFQNYISYDNIYGIPIQNADYTSVINQSGYEVLGYRSIGSGKVIYMAHENYNAYLQNQLLVKNIYLSSVKNGFSYDLPSAIPAGDSVAVTVQIDAKKLLAGDHQCLIGMSTNDPLRPYIQAVVNLHISGSAGLAVSTNTVQFGVLQQFTSTTASVNVNNNGCDTLIFNNLSFSSPDFTVTNAPFQVLPYTQITLQLSFHPQGAGNYSDSLYISSNGGSTAIALHAIVVGAPVAQVMPGSLTAVLDCDQTNMYSLDLANTGLGGYQYSTTHTGPVRVAVLYYGAAPDRLYNVVTILQNQFPAAVIIPITSNDPGLMADSLQKADILVIPFIDNAAPQDYALLKAPVQDFMNSGGVVLMTGTHISEVLAKMGLISINTGLGSSVKNTIVNSMKSHPLTAGVADKTSGNQFMFGAEFPESDGFTPVLKLRLDNAYDAEYLSWKKKGNGFLLWWGHTFDDADTLTDRLMRNIINWAYQPLTPGTTLVSGQSGTLAPNGTQTIKLNISGNDLAGGDYPGQIRIYGNDPVHNPLIIPVLLQISEKPCTAFSVVQSDCGGKVIFNDETLNNLNSWYWAFGDNYESFEEHPEHIYTSEGVFSVTLVGCNDAGCDTATQVITISGVNGPVAGCQPQIVSTCCGAGVHLFQLGDINYAGTGADFNGYQDRSCIIGTDLVAGDQYALQMTSGGVAHEYLRVWIDLNNDGVFSENERLYNDYQFIDHNGYLIVPNNVVKNIPLRMRVLSSWNDYGPCGQIVNGNAIDFYVVVKQAVGTQETGNEFTDAVISPNPSATDSRFTFSLPTAESAVLTVMNMAGQVVESRTMELQPGEQQIVLSHREAGVYSVRLQTAGGTLVRNWVCLER